MTQQSKTPIAEKSGLHPRNPHRSLYNFKELILANPALAPFVVTNKFKVKSIDFANPEAVKQLNKALLKHFYGIAQWDIPKNYLCPPIPGRADYIHYIADLLAESNGRIFPSAVKVLDIGTGANCIYPILGHQAYGWKFIATDIDPLAIRTAKHTIQANAAISKAIECRYQKDSTAIFKNIMKPGEVFDVTMCNPPFHSSAAEAKEVGIKKARNLGIDPKDSENPILNFGGQNNELWCDGGESKFIWRMVEESALISTSSFWFTTLVSKKDNLARVYSALQKVGALEVKTIEMTQGQKVSRIVAWTFLDKEKQQQWREKRWETKK